MSREKTCAFFMPNIKINYFNSLVYTVFQKNMSKPLPAVKYLCSIWMYIQVNTLLYKCRNKRCSADVSSKEGVRL